MNARRVALCGMLIAVMLALGALERLIVLVPGVPGIKLGLGNVVLLFALYELRTRDAFTLMTLKACLGGFLYLNVTGALYALGGGFLATLVMAVSIRTKKLSTVGVSVLGAASHITGQILVSRLLLGTWAAAAQLPLLLVAAVIAGTLTGIAAGATLRALKKSTVLKRWDIV